MTATTTAATTNAAPLLPGRRWLDPAATRRFAMRMRNDFLTPQGRPYKWQELSATLDRVVVDGGVPSVVPVRYRWRRVDSRTGSPDHADQQREWTFARGQSFTSMLLHAAVEPGGATGEPGGPSHTMMDISYPQLPKSPAVDLLLMLSWDVVTLEMLCTHLGTRPELRETGSRADLAGITDTWAELHFSNPAAVAVFRNARMTGQHLGTGRFAGRRSTVYAARCLDSGLEVSAGPVRQRGRSSYWLTLQADADTGDLLAAEMTEMIVATVSGADGRRVPVQKRRIVELWLDTDAGEGAGAAITTPAGTESAQAEPPEVDTDLLTETIRLAGRAADYVAWQMQSLEYLPAGMADLARMGFRSVVGTDLAGTYQQVRSMQAGLRAIVAGQAGAHATVRAALPGFRLHVEGLVAFGQLAVDGTERSLAATDPGRDASRRHLATLGADLTALLTLLGRLERPHPAHAPNDHEPEGKP